MSGIEVMEALMVQRVMKEAWANDDELGWAGLGPDWLTGLDWLAAEGAGCRRNRLHTSGAASHSLGASLHRPAHALPNPNQQT